MDLSKVSSQNMVLLVDDQPIVGEAVRKILLDSKDLSFHYCQDACDVLELVREVKPSVILLDLVMPDIDGITLLRYLRENPATSMVPVVMLSGKEAAEEKAAAFEAGANDYLVKIPDAAELIARLRYHCKFYLNILQRNAAYQALEISQNKLAESNLKLQQAALKDGLTGVHNRRYFDTKFTEDWHRAVRNKENLSLVLVDIDFFKHCNDRYGHLAGDETLRQVAQAMDSCFKRRSDDVMRYGGEEFVLLLPGTDEAGAVKLAEMVCRTVEDLNLPNEDSDISNFITVSAGVVSMIPLVDTDRTCFLDTADKALYEAKQAGRNRVMSKAYVGKIKSE